jgi:adenylosuccinate synthase
VSATCVIGLQWGDEAKGKLVDLLAPRFDLVVRYQGGANAGHTVVCGDQKYKLHHIPSGILHPRVRNVITPGVVINPETLLQEIDGLQGRGVDVASDRLVISERAHLVMPWHFVEDRLINQRSLGQGGESIGTTLRGIGPCYRDKVGRTHAVRTIDLLRPERDRYIAETAEAKSRTLRALGASESELESIEPARVVELAQRWADRLRPFVADTTELVISALEHEQALLFEGAQGALLDIDHGTYPFVTSSNSSGVGVCAGAGVPPLWIDQTIGVVKAYSTRVGGGPFPSELLDSTGDRIRELGHEYGTTTGRPRRCGWFDAVAVRYTARLSGVTRLALMMMDVIGQLDEIAVCVAYELDGQRINRLPCHADDLRRCKPVLETMPGFRCDLTQARDAGDLPAGAWTFIRWIERLIGVPVGIVSVGPDRAQTIFLDSMAEVLPGVGVIERT